MTDRIHALTVILESDVREDELEPTIEAIKQLRGVLNVRTHVISAADAVARDRAVQHYAAALWDAFEKVRDDYSHGLDK